MLVFNWIRLSAIWQIFLFRISFWSGDSCAPIRDITILQKYNFSCGFFTPASEAGRFPAALRNCSSEKTVLWVKTTWQAKIQKTSKTLQCQNPRRRLPLDLAWLWRQTPPLILTPSLLESWSNTSHCASGRLKKYTGKKWSDYLYSHRNYMKSTWLSQFLHIFICVFLYIHSSHTKMYFNCIKRLC